MTEPPADSQGSNNSKASVKVPGTKSAWSQIVRGIQGIQVSSDSNANNAASDTSAPATPKTVSEKKASVSPAPSTEESLSPQTEVDASPKPIKQAWKKPSTSPADTPVGPVMGAVSWPALGDTADHKVHEGQVDLGQGDPAPTSPTASDSGEPKSAARRLNLPAEVAPSVERPARYNGDSPRPNAGGSRPYYQQGGYQGNRRNTREQGRNNWNSRNYVSNQGGIPNRMGPRHYAPQATTTYVNVNPGFISPAGPPTGMYYVQSPGAAPMHGAGYYGTQILVPVPDHTALKQMLSQQIEYYFSVDNLCRDVFLRRHMDEQGFVPLSVIASFNRVRSLTADKNLILDALRDSDIVEIEGDKLRPKHDWGKWLIKLDGTPFGQETVPQDNRGDGTQQRFGGVDTESFKTGGLSTAFGSSAEHAFQLDEELGVYSHGEEDDSDVKDHDVQRLIIVTQHENYKSSGGHWQSGIPEDVAKTINDGLYYYEQQLSDERMQPAAVDSNGAEANGLHAVDNQRLFKTAVHTRLGKHVVAESPPNPVGFLFGTPDVHNYVKPSASSSLANASVGSPPTGSAPKPFPRFQHPSHALLEKNGFEHQKYMKFYNRCLTERKLHGIGNSEEMNTLFRFWSYFLRTNFHRGMYKQFHSLAMEDFHEGFSYGMECLFRFYSYGLEQKFKPSLYDDFEQLVLYTYKRGNLYGLEKYWAFHFYRKGEPVKKHPELERLLAEQFRTLEDFHKANHANEAAMNGNGGVDESHESSPDEPENSKK